MASAEKTAQALETVLRILRPIQHPADFVDLVRAVKSQANVDEATAKSLILRLHFEGEITICPNWTVAPVTAESERDCDLVLEAAAA